MKTNQAIDNGAYSVDGFCKAFGGFTRTHFYNLLKTGKAPRIFRVGRRTLISREAAAEWVSKMEEETASREVADE